MQYLCILIMITPTVYIEDEIYGQRLLISKNADQRELPGNIRAARAILHSFAEVTIIINAHTMSFGHKNPEYIIDGQLVLRLQRNKVVRLWLLISMNISFKCTLLNFQNISHEGRRIS